MAQAILLKDVEDLGSAGDAVDVSPGYLRNYLQPRKLAQPATQASLDEAVRRREKRRDGRPRGRGARRRDRRAALEDGADDPAPRRRGRQALRLGHQRRDRRGPRPGARPQDRPQEDPPRRPDPRDRHLHGRGRDRRAAPRRRSRRSSPRPSRHNPRSARLLSSASGVARVSRRRATFETSPGLNWPSRGGRHGEIWGIGRQACPVCVGIRAGRRSESRSSCASSER